MIALYILIVALIVYGGCVTGAFVASEHQRKAERRQLVRGTDALMRDAYQSGIEDGRDEVVWQLVDVLEISTIGQMDRDKCHRDLTDVLNRRKEENHAECGSGTGTAGC